MARARFRVPAIAFFVALDVIALGLLPVSERVTAVCRSAVAPGLGLLPEHSVIAGVLLAATFLCTWAWFRWGMVLPVLAVWWIGIVLTLRLFPSEDHSHPPTALGEPRLPGVALAAHEFTWVMAVYVLVYWGGLWLRRVPLVARIASRRQRQRPAGETALLHLPLAERARAVALWEVARRAGGAAPPTSFLANAISSARSSRNAKVISMLGHGRWQAAPDQDNAGVRAALILTGGDPSRASEDAAASRLGMPASEPGWVSLLDGTLLAAALDSAGDAAGRRWALVLHRWFRLQRGHRPEARHDFLGVTRGNAPAWEQAAAAAIAAGHGWCEPAAEWQALRRRVFAAIGRGGRTSDDNRLVAAGRCWAALMKDDDALHLLRRVTSSPRDPVAQALDALAAALAATNLTVSSPVPLQSDEATGHCGAQVAPGLSANQARSAKGDLHA
jgi:hypothetical protein